VRRGGRKSEKRKGEKRKTEAGESKILKQNGL
jgi:hypothetical protein